MDAFLIYPNYWTPLPPSFGNITLESNYFDVPRSFGGNPNGYSLYIGTNGPQPYNTMYGWRIRNNFFDPRSYGVNNDQQVGPDNIFCGNYGGHPGLPSS